jgi:hypothetical protein
VAFLCLKIVLSGQILGFAALVSCSSIWSHDDNRLCKGFRAKQMVREEVIQVLHRLEWTNLLLFEYARLVSGSALCLNENGGVSMPGGTGDWTKVSSGMLTNPSSG